MRISDWSSDGCTTDLPLHLSLKRYRPIEMISHDAVTVVDQDLRHGCIEMCAGYCAELAIKIGHDAKLLRHGDQQVGKGGPVDVGRGHLSAYEIPAAIRRLTDKTAGKPFDDISQSAPGRSDARGVGTECGRTCRTRWSPYNEKKNDIKDTR